MVRLQMKLLYATVRHDYDDNYVNPIFVLHIKLCVFLLRLLIVFQYTFMQWGTVRYYLFLAITTHGTLILSIIFTTFFSLIKAATRIQRVMFSLTEHKNLSFMQLCTFNVVQVSESTVFCLWTVIVSFSKFTLLPFL